MRMTDITLRFKLKMSLVNRPLLRVKCFVLEGLNMRKKKKRDL